ncbi:MAG: hypothetical protein BWX64_02059 [Acidobacteria bacterium ADurb.Bin051]|nr:MAG: hypothetical protein BWX64_02059 [Acidobacteria bacterium ADurb.Bin051]
MPVAVSPQIGPLPGGGPGGEQRRGVEELDPFGGERGEEGQLGGVPEGRRRSVRGEPLRLDRRLDRHRQEQERDSLSGEVGVELPDRRSWIGGAGGRRPRRRHPMPAAARRPGEERRPGQVVDVRAEVDLAARSGVGAFVAGAEQPGQECLHRRAYRGGEHRLPVDPVLDRREARGELAVRGGQAGRQRPGEQPGEGAAIGEETAARDLEPPPEERQRDAEGEQGPSGRRPQAGGGHLGEGLAFAGGGGKAGHRAQKMK